MVQQTVYFGPPGSGKSHAAQAQARALTGWKPPQADGAEQDDPYVVRTVFHPETSYGDFVAKLLPSTYAAADENGKPLGKIRYDVHAGPLVEAIALAWCCLKITDIDDKPQQVVLIIEEINRGPASGIFGDMFQLLDRAADGQSSYPIEISQLVASALAAEYHRRGGPKPTDPMGCNPLKLPVNLHILATMNTSDESVHYMDAAFKRRWEWAFVPWDHKPEEQADVPEAPPVLIEGPDAATPGMAWTPWLQNLNDFIADAAQNDMWLRRSVDDKLVGLHWLRAQIALPTQPPAIARFDIRNKLMQYLWDNVFARNRKPLQDLLDKHAATLPAPGAAPVALPLALLVDLPVTSPQQTIFFGPPGSGKSHAAQARAVALVGEDKAGTHIFRTLFHPDTTYGDFVAKLMPMSDGEGRVSYRTHPGPMLKAVACARANPDAKVVLVIDEINRGHSAAVFGDFFQLLDRNPEGASAYGLTLQKLCADALSQAAPGLDVSQPFKLPANLSILATMNTSDASVFTMDTAFKRRWGWEFVPWDAGAAQPGEAANLYAAHLADCPATAGNYPSWGGFLEKLNRWIADTAPAQGRDDKLVGLWVGKRETRAVTAISAFLNNATICNGSGSRLALSVFEALKQASAAAAELKLSWVVDSVAVLNKRIPIPASTIDDWHNWRQAGEAVFPQHIYRDPKFPIPAVNTAIAHDRLSAAMGEIFHIERTHPRTPFSPHIATLHYVVCPKNALSHFLWDNVFQRNRDPIAELINQHRTAGKQAPIQLRTYGDYLHHWQQFMQAILARPVPTAAEGLHTFGDFQAQSNAFITAIDQWNAATPAAPTLAAQAVPLDPLAAQPGA